MLDDPDSPFPGKAFVLESSVSAAMATYQTPSRSQYKLLLIAYESEADARVAKDRVMEVCREAFPVSKNYTEIVVDPPRRGLPYRAGPLSVFSTHEGLHTAIAVSKKFLVAAVLSDDKNASIHTAMAGLSRLAAVSKK